MVLRVEQDHSRFRQIVRGKIRKELRKYITRDELLGRQGKDLVSIPVPQIELPKFRFHPDAQGGVGQGEGEAGTPIGRADARAGTGAGAGEAPGAHLLEVDVTLDELARLLGEELELPRIEPRGKHTVTSHKDRYRSIRSTGPESLRHFKRTYKKALKRQLASGTYNAECPVIIPIKEDRLYRSWRDVEDPENSALVVYLMDVSGSMGDEQKEIVRIEAFWIDTWLRSQYRKIETRYIVHDAAASLVDRETFFHLRESGGTKISSAYELLRKLIQNEFPVDEWNIYPFQFSDGDNWGGGDTEVCLKILEGDLLPAVNLFCYGQVESPYGSGQFAKDLEARFPDAETLVVSRIEGKEQIYDSIRQFLGKGR
jgi:uncharacterized sporulation protein YeaH/YhbH (DUF444 family)